MAKRRIYNYTSTSSGARQDPPDAGGGAPAWVPANAKIHIDFLGGTPQGRAWVQGTGEVAIGVLLGTDTNTTTGWGPTEYSSSGITADGYVYSTSPPAFIGAARTHLVAAVGFTMRVQFKRVSPSDPNALALMSVNGVDAIQVSVSGTTSLRGASWGGSLTVTMSNIITGTAGAVNGIAFTLAGVRYEQAANGSNVAMYAPAEIDETDRPPGNPLVAAVIDPLGQAIQSITLYDPLPDTTGLSDLSEV